MGIRFRLLAAVAMVTAMVTGVGLLPVQSPAPDTAAATAPMQAVPTGGGSPQVTLHTRYTKVSGRKIAWARVGRGPRMVLLNGTGSPMSHWDPKFLSRLAATHEAVVFDYPGLGQSAAPKKKITMGRLAKWTSKFLRKNGWRKSHILGWSMGGFVAQKLASKSREQVKTLTLIGTNPGGSATTLGPKWAQRIDSDPNAGLSGYLRTNYARNSCGRSTGKAVVNRINRAISSGRYPAEVIPNKTYNQMVRAEDGWLRSESNSRKLAQFSGRALVIVGSADVVTPPANSQYIASRIPRASLVEVQNAGHSVQFSDSGRVVSAIANFLAKQSVPASVQGRCG